MTWSYLKQHVLGQHQPPAPWSLTLSLTSPEAVQEHPPNRLGALTFGIWECTLTICGTTLPKNDMTPNSGNSPLDPPSLRLICNLCAVDILSCAQAMPVHELQMANLSPSKSLVLVCFSWISIVGAMSGWKLSPFAMHHEVSIPIIYLLEWQSLLIDFIDL